jgi:hypothetical protein
MDHLAVALINLFIGIATDVAVSINRQPTAFTPPAQVQVVPQPQEPKTFWQRGWAHQSFDVGSNANGQ